MAVWMCSGHLYIIIRLFNNQNKIFSLILVVNWHEEQRKLATELQVVELL